MSERQKTATVVVLLVLATCIVFSGALFNDFIEDYDDSLYVLDNKTVRAGLTWRGLRYALTSECAGNWHPLTMLSHMLDCQLYGVHPFGHHLTNIVLHAANAAVLFLVLHRMTGACWRSAVVAALFALHPLHVQSVAHIAQRKDVLSTLFWFLTMGAYVWYCTRPSIKRYAWVTLLFVLGLLSKPMLVSLPIVLLFMDYWPLNRFSLKNSRAGQVVADLLPCLREKIPLFTLTVVMSVITFLVQRSAEAVSTLAERPLLLRLANATVSYVAYMRMAVWPSGLAAHYPFPSDVPIGKAAASATVLLLLTLLSLVRLRNRPYFAVGWFWYLITLIPVIGLVQVGSQAMADRYTYVPLTGLFIAVAWGAADAAPHRPRIRMALTAFACGALIVFALCTWRQLQYWRNTETLWRRALAVTTNNAVAHSFLGSILRKQGHLEEGLAHAIAAVRIWPYPDEMVNVGIALMLVGRTAEAEEHFKKALAKAPNHSSAYYNLGLLYLTQERFEEAEDAFAKVRPQSGELHATLARAYLEAGHPEKAELHCRESLKLEPTDATTYITYGLVCQRQGRSEEAIRAFQEAVRLDPRLGDAESLMARLREPHRTQPGMLPILPH